MIYLLSIFKWILYSSVLGSVLACIIISFKFIFKKRLGVRWHYCIWLLLVIRLILPYAPQSSLSVFNIFHLTENNLIEHKSMQTSNSLNYSIPKTITEFTENQPSVVKQPKYETQINNINTAPNNTINSISQPIEPKNYTVSIYFKLACFIWLIGAILPGLYELAITIKFKIKLITQQKCTNEHILKLLNSCKKKINLNKNITILNTDLVKTPAVFGFIKPKLLLPIGIDKQLNLQELQYIIFHEMSHLKRKDIPVNCITYILQTLHWFNPILWYSFYKMRQDREVACDALALSYIDTNECIKYGETIIKLLESYKKTNCLYGMTFITNNKSQIKRRITMISLFKKNSYKWSIIPIVILIVLGCIFLTNPKNNSVSASNNNCQKSKSNTILNYKSEGKRGKIVDRNEQPLALNKDKADIKNYYPNKNLFTQVETQYDKYLSQSNKNVVLTMDSNIQNFCEKTAEKALTDNKAKAVSIIVMNPNNGEILSMVNKSNSEYKNNAISTSFEPGSIFKAIVAAAALNEKVIDPHSYKITCNGKKSVEHINISCWKTSGHGEENFEDILKNSCNIGFIDLGEKLGAEKLNKYIKIFGFGKKTGIDLPGEVNGIIKETKDISPIDLATISFGQTNTSTPIQYLTAFNAIANGGKWIRPHVMKEIVHYDNKNKIVDKSFNNYSAKQILDKPVSAQLRGYLEKIVSKGYCKKAYIKGYNIAGIAGTSQKAINGEYYSRKYISSFVGTAPIIKGNQNSQITVLICIDEPDSSNYYASQIAAPVGKQIFNYIFNSTFAHKK